MRTDSILQPNSEISQVQHSTAGHTVPIKWRWPKGSKNLLILFHGAVDRNNRVPPVFPSIIPELGDGVAQVSVSDPMMLRAGPHRISWYAGSEDFPAQTILNDLFSGMIQNGGFERVVFFGSSGGGFASLFYSSLIAGSIAVAACPQTNLNRYYSTHLNQYIEGCWPALTHAEELENVICSDLCTWYSTPRDNTVIYLQNSSDHFHTGNHMAPFLSGIARAGKARFLVNSDFWGDFGHSIDISSCVLWLRAAFLSKTIEVDDLLLTHHSLRSAAREGSGGTVKHEKTQIGTVEYRQAALLRDYHLR